MANDEEKLTTDQRVNRSVRRTLSWLGLGAVFLGLLVAWGSLGAFTLKEGDAAVILRLGKHVRTITDAGFKLTLPPPFDERVIVSSGLVPGDELPSPPLR